MAMAFIRIIFFLLWKADNVLQNFLTETVRAKLDVLSVLSTAYILMWESASHSLNPKIQEYN